MDKKLFYANCAALNSEHTYRKYNVFEVIQTFISSDSIKETFYFQDIVEVFFSFPISQQCVLNNFHGKEEYDNGFEAEIIEQETFRIVRKAVEELPTQMRNIILYSMKGLKNNEIADKLQISEGTVHKLKKIAYRKLRESLKGINYILCLFLCK